MLDRRSEVQYLVEQVLNQAQILMYGPIGIGKTTVLHEVARLVRANGCACAYHAKTAGLGDVTKALAGAFSGVQASKQRQLRNKLQLLLEEQPAVLLLDHLTVATAAMKGYLRKLSGQVGVVFAVDAEHARDHADARSLHLAYREFKIPPLRRNHIRTILADRLGTANLPYEIVAEDLELLIDIAHGRPGWIEMLLERLSEVRYWKEGRIRMQLLEFDVTDQIGKRYMVF